MTQYKRNQLEEAIPATLRTTGVQIQELRLKIKRLLLTDRRLHRAKRSDRGQDRYAFYSAKPQGTGTEVLFTGYEVFAVMAAVVVLEHGIPQAKVVSILQRVRSDLEVAHRETLHKAPEELFDQEAVRAQARPGMIATDNTAPVFLAFVKLDAGKGKVRAIVSICRGQDELVRFIRQHSMPGSGATHFELVRLMHNLAAQLVQTRPVKRGRSTI